MKTLLSEIAYTVRGEVISEENIYYNYNKNGIPVYSSNTKNQGLIGTVNMSFYNDSNAKGEAGEITWTTDGNAGNFILRHEPFLFTNVCGKIIIKKKYQKIISPQWLALYLNLESKKYVTSKGGNSKLMKEQVDNIEINIININLQDKLVKEFDIRINKLNLLISILKKLNNQISKKIISKSKIFLMKELFDITSGRRITQNDIYNNSGDFPAVTSQTKNEGIAWYGDRKWLTSIEKNSKKVYVSEECLTWTKDGAKCGTIFHRDYEFYPNDHCGVLIPKVELNLKWVRQQIQPILYNQVIAKDAQGMLYEEQMANIEVDIPVDDNGEIDLAIQNKIYSEYYKLIQIKKNLENILEKYSI